MDVYQEILGHSGPGRLGAFHLGMAGVVTPNFFHPVSSPGRHDIYIARADSRTRKKPAVYDHSLFRGKRVSPSKFGILPDFPAGFDVPREIAEDAVEETLKAARENPGHGAVLAGAGYPELIARCAGELEERPLLVFPSGQRLAAQPRLLAEVVPLVREAASPNTALYFPLAPPSLFPVLAYMGVDFFDSTAAVLGAAKGEFLTPRGFAGIRAAGEAACYCRACLGAPAVEVIENQKALFGHNMNFLRGAVSEIREAIANDRLRELVEEKAGYDAGAMAVLRLLDHEKGEYLERYTPVASRSEMRFISQESYSRPEVKRWQERLEGRYSPPEGKRLSVILPCSARKPYSKSRSHRVFRRYIRSGAGRKRSLVHEVVMTSPLGIVPRELEGVYPASRYDIPVTGHWTEDEKGAALGQLKQYLAKAGTLAIAHVDGAYREICAEAGVELGKERVMSRGSLEHLRERIAEVLEGERPGGADKAEGARAVCEYQFGRGAGKYLLPEGTRVRRYQLFYDGEQVAAFNPSDGLLALTIRGGEMLREYGKHLVELSFEPKSDSIFAVGVEKAGEEIRPGDEVIAVYKGEVVGVGRANLSGTEMQRAWKGLAVKLRHRR